MEVLIGIAALIILLVTADTCGRMIGGFVDWWDARQDRKSVQHHEAKLRAVKKL